jgi:hypothetical protein
MLALIFEAMAVVGSTYAAIRTGNDALLWRLTCLEIDVVFRRFYDDPRRRADRPKVQIGRQIPGSLAESSDIRRSRIPGEPS